MAALHVLTLQLQSAINWTDASKLQPAPTKYSIQPDSLAGPIPQAAMRVLMGTCNAHLRSSARDVVAAGLQYDSTYDSGMASAGSQGA